jgi:hypothetical protein
MVTTATAFISVSMTKGTMKSDERVGFELWYWIAAGLIGCSFMFQGFATLCEKKIEIKSQSREIFISLR